MAQPTPIQIVESIQSGVTGDGNLCARIAIFVAKNAGSMYQMSLLRGALNEIDENLWALIATLEDGAFEE